MGKLHRFSPQRVPNAQKFEFVALFSTAVANKFETTGKTAFVVRPNAIFIQNYR